MINLKNPIVSKSGGSNINIKTPNVSGSSGKGGINTNFIEDAIPEFVLYWKERGDKSNTWDSKFVQHVKRQWNFYTGLTEINNEQTGDITIEYELVDPSSDDLGILFEYSIDNGVSWLVPTTLTGDTSSIGSDNYFGSIA